MTTPLGWTQTTLGKECRIEIGGTPSRGVDAYWDMDRSTTNAWVSIKDMHSRSITNTAERISNLGVRHSNVKLQPKGTVLLSFKLTIGRVAFAGLPLYTNEAIAGLQSKTLDSKYLYHGLQQWDLLQGVDQAIKGATLNKAKLKKISFVCPKSRDEQSKIAEVLSTVDRAIAQTKALIAKQQRIKTGLMQDLLTRGIDEHGQLRSEATHAFKDSPFGRIPAEWEIKKLDHCVRADAPICYGILMPGTGFENGIPVIKVKDILGGAIRLDNLLLTDPSIDAAYRRSRLEAGDLLMTIRGTTGRIAIVPPSLDGANITQDTARIRLESGHFAKYFFFLMQADAVQRQVELQTMGQAVKGINIADVRKLQLAIPVKNEQMRISQVLEQIHLAWLASSKHRKKLVLLKTALMQDLLTGKVRVTPLLHHAEEPAHA